MPLVRVGRLNCTGKHHEFVLTSTLFPFFHRRYEQGDEKTLSKQLGSHKLAEQGILSLDFNEDMEGLFVGCDLDNTLRVGMLHL